MAVRIARVLDGNLADIEGGKYNIFIPISLGNLYFTRERVKELVEWSLEHSKEGVAILVADKIHAINYEVLKEMSKQNSRDAALRLGDDFVRMAERVVRSLSEEQQGKVVVARWDDVEVDKFAEMQKFLREEYSSNKEFQREVYRIVKTNLDEKVPDGESSLHRLGSYIVEELPLMLHGIKVKNRRYEVFLYPGLTELDRLASDIQNRRRFSKLADHLQLEGTTPLIEAYVEN